MLLTLDGDGEEKQDDFLLNSEERRKEETRHIHSDTALNLVRMSVGPLSSLFSLMNIICKQKVNRYLCKALSKKLKL